ncbi:TonB-dependent receptor [Novosphingobium sp. JCM 18896]|uniref:TonB-dependent receptor n=1 Tax=Novosphingobium sp. JCM 18896 TaxID=2989731 RepID=UPI002223B7D5|nr:TonB-dependent receptor [Novosphingobium sp. JCM 18896]MCW1429655.1 TonB-dependent receptor [Novosphingobium sp. JCM 18896]
MTGRVRISIIAGALAGAASMGTAAWGQDRVPAVHEDPASADASEIIVTAQRRSERLRDVPISITALTADTLVQSGINNTLDIARVTPGVQLPLYGGFLQPSIRGISSASAGLGDSSNVAIYVDGVYQPSQSGQLVDLPDIQQVEVLKGPQGTLYGQNAAGGAIILTSVAPSFDLTGRFSASYGNYDHWQVRGYISGPLVEDRIAISVAGSFEDRNGFRRNVATGGRDSGLQSELIRARLLFQASDRVSFTLGGYYSRRSDGGQYAGQPVGPGTPLGYALAGLVGLNVPRANDPQSYALNVDPLTLIRSYGFNLLGKFDTDFGTFNTVTAYGNVKVRDVADADYTAVNLGDVDLNIFNDHFIQELNFTSAKWGRATLSAGLFYMALKESYAPNTFNGYFTGLTDPVTAFPTTPSPLFRINQYAYNRKRSYAAYAELGYELTDRLNVSIAGRYSYETQQTADNYSQLTGAQGPTLTADPRGKISFERFTPRATIRYAIDDSSNVYATYSQGFKSGYVNSGDNPAANPPLEPVQPEKVFAYEVGYKGRLAPGISLNLSAFWYDYKDLQVYVYSPPNQFYRNAAAARIKGIDGDITIQAAPGLTLTAGASYVDGKYRSFPDAVVYRPNAFGFGYDTVGLDASGRRMQRAPKFTANAAISYETTWQAGTFGLYLAGNYNSGLNYDVAANVRQSAYALLDGQLSFSPAGIEGLRLVVWGKNLTNKDYLASFLGSQFVLGGSYAEPRTYGVRAEFKF